MRGAGEEPDQETSPALPPGVWPVAGATGGTAEGFPIPPELSEPLWEWVANKSPALAPAQMLVSISSRRRGAGGGVSGGVQGQGQEGPLTHSVPPATG